MLLCELRWRSRSLLAPMGLHWATNALGYRRSGQGEAVGLADGDAVPDAVPVATAPDAAVPVAEGRGVALPIGFGPFGS